MERYYRCGAVLPLVTLRPYYRWQCGTTAGVQKRERESLKDAEDEAEVPGTPAVLLLWSHGRHYHYGAVLPLGSLAVLPLGCAVLPLGPRQDKEERRDLFNGMEMLGG